MKKSIKFFAMLLMATVLTFSLNSCKDEPVEPTQQQQGNETPDTPEPQNNFNGTSWFSTLNTSTTYQGVQMNISLDADLDFIDGSTGELYMNVYVELPLMPSMNQELDESQTFTYTVNGNIISITYQYEDQETGETTTYTDDLVYDPASETITYDMNDADMESLLGTDVIVFSKRQ